MTATVATPLASGVSAMPSHAVLEQAADWYACLRDGEASFDQREAWQVWLQADSEHQLAWQYVQQVCRGFEPLWDMPQPQQMAECLQQTRQSRSASRRRLLTGAGVMLTASVLGYWRQHWLPAGLMALGADLRTAKGEQREWMLADGSRVWLNTDSAINLALDARLRKIELVLGEVFIQTAADARRPLVVHTDHGRMQALGTRFNVQRMPTKTCLAVFEGAVAVRTRQGREAIVQAGQQLEFNAQAMFSQGSAPSAREAWTQGVLVADNIRLADLVDELRRYRPGHLGLAEELAELRVYGHFPLREPDRVLQMLAMALPIRIEQRFDWWVSIEAQA